MTEQGAIDNLDYNIKLAHDKRRPEARSVVRSRPQIGGAEVGAAGVGAKYNGRSHTLQTRTEVLIRCTVMHCGV
eukprot:4954044-Pyramimonas_sp.AAC.1